MSLRSPVTTSAAAAVAVLLLVFALFMLARGMIETWPVFLSPVQSGLGWDRAGVASVYSVLMMAFGLGGID